MVQTIIINQSKIEAIQPMSVSTEKIKSAVANSSLFTIHFSLKSIYRKELRMARAAARAIDAHPTISNIFLWLTGIGIMVRVLLA